jgi:hypothetical protein
MFGHFERISTGLQKGWASLDFGGLKTFFLAWVILVIVLRDSWVLKLFRAIWARSRVFKDIRDRLDALFKEIVRFLPNTTLLFPLNSSNFASFGLFLLDLGGFFLKEA